ncbi:hypothetical protein B0H14DRAFT_3582502 [Mycena olivaceomarginata]|nr:hypothetical protein B0H14DRAFT_3582502 [Mycena olivaceomarginata]
MAFLWRSGTTNEKDEDSKPSPKQEYGTRITATFIFVLGVIYLGLMIRDAKRMGSDSTEEFGGTGGSGQLGGGGGGGEGPHNYPGASSELQEREESSGKAKERRWRGRQEISRGAVKYDRRLPFRRYKSPPSKILPTNPPERMPRMRRRKKSSRVLYLMINLPHVDQPAREGNRDHSLEIAVEEARGSGGSQNIDGPSPQMLGL